MLAGVVGNCLTNPHCNPYANHKHTRSSLFARWSLCTLSRYPLNIREESRVSAREATCLKVSDRWTVQWSPVSLHADLKCSKKLSSLQAANDQSRWGTSGGFGGRRSTKAPPVLALRCVPSACPSNLASSRGVFCSFCWYLDLRKIFYAPSFVRRLATTYALIGSII